MYKFLTKMKTKDLDKVIFISKNLENFKDRLVIFPDGIDEQIINEVVLINHFYLSKNKQEKYEFDAKVSTIASLSETSKKEIYRKLSNIVGKYMTEPDLYSQVKLRINREDYLILEEYKDEQITEILEKMAD